MDHIKLSQELLDQLFAALNEHDPNCKKDELVAIQYLAAVIGMVAARQLHNPEERKTLISDMADFIQFVGQDVAEQIAQAMPEGKKPSQSAFGIWTPGSD